MKQEDQEKRDEHDTQPVRELPFLGPEEVAQEEEEVDRGEPGRLAERRLPSRERSCFIEDRVEFVGHGHDGFGGRSVPYDAGTHIRP